MSGFTFGIGKDDVKDSVLKDTDFFDKDSIKAGETPEFNTDTSIVNLDSDTDTLEQKQEFEQRALDDVSRTTANSNVSVESLIEKIKRNNGVNKAIAFEAYDLGFREQLPKVFTYTDKFSETNLGVTLETLENYTPENPNQ